MWKREYYCGQTFDKGWGWYQSKLWKQNPTYGCLWKKPLDRCRRAKKRLKLHSLKEIEEKHHQQLIWNGALISVLYSDESWNWCQSKKWNQNTYSCMWKEQWYVDYYLIRDDLNLSDGNKNTNNCCMWRGIFGKPVQKLDRGFNTHKTIETNITKITTESEQKGVVQQRFHLVKIISIETK